MSDEKPTSAAGQKAELSKSDRMELRRVVKSRFELLREQMETRAKEIRKLLRKEIEASYASSIEKGEKEGKALADEFMKLARKAEALRLRMDAKGLAAYQWEKEITKVVEGFIDTHLTGWEPEDVNDRVNEMVETIKDQHGYASLSLRSEELQLLENLSLDALESPEAKGFLDSIPEVDDFLPLPEGASLKALTAGV